MKKKLAGIAITVLTTVMIASPVYAGEINAYEQDLYNYCCGVFEYDGKYYKASDAALSSLYAELMSDSRDLNEYQCRSAKRMMLRQMQDGIDAGYMIEVEAPSSEENSEGENGETDTVEDEMNTSSQNESDNSDQTTQKKDEEVTTENKESTSEKNPDQDGEKQSTSEKNPDSNVVPENGEQTTEENIFSQEDEASFESDVMVETIDLKEVFKGEKEVKNTGYSLTGLLYLVGAGMLGLVGAIVLYICNRGEKDET